MLKVLSRRQVREKVSLSYAQIARLEAERKFPARFRLTEHPNGRCGWLESEVDNWIEERLRKRTSQ